MDSHRVVLVICLTVVIVIGINAAIYAMVADRQAVNLIDMIKRSAHTARRPWQGEDASLNELSKRVEDLKKDKEE
jgi:hypothetical protein